MTNKNKNEKKMDDRGNLLRKNLIKRKKRK